MTASQWQILPAKQISYGHPKRSFGKLCRKVWNTILSRWAYSCPSNALRVVFNRWRGCHIGKGVYIGRYCYFDNMYPEYIYICDGASINAQVMILTHFNPFDTWQGVLSAEVKPVVIGENAIVAVRSTIMPGVTIGRHAVVPAAMVVEKDVADYHLIQLKTTTKEVDMSPLFQVK